MLYLNNCLCGCELDKIIFVRSQLVGVPDGPRIRVRAAKERAGTIAQYKPDPREAIAPTAKRHGRDGALHLSGRCGRAGEGCDAMQRDGVDLGRARWDGLWPDNYGMAPLDTPMAARASQPDQEVEGGVALAAAMVMAAAVVGEVVDVLVAAKGLVKEMVMAAAAAAATARKAQWETEAVVMNVATG